MNLVDGKNGPIYAVIKASGRIELNPDVPNARELCVKYGYANLLAALDNQDEADVTIDETLRVLKKRGALGDEEAEVFQKLERTKKDRKDKKEGKR
jgi:hypothetical protein